MKRKSTREKEEENDEGYSISEKEKINRSAQTRSWDRGIGSGVFV